MQQYVLSGWPNNQLGVITGITDPTAPCGHEMKKKEPTLSQN